MTGPDEKICPDCAETIKAAARVCRYCTCRFDAASAPTPSHADAVSSSARPDCHHCGNTGELSHGSQCGWCSHYDSPENQARRRARAERQSAEAMAAWRESSSAYPGGEGEPTVGGILKSLGRGAAVALHNMEGRCRHCRKKVSRIAERCPYCQLPPFSNP